MTKNGVPNKKVVLQICPEYVPMSQIFAWISDLRNLFVSTLFPYRGPDLLTPTSTNIVMEENFDPMGGLIGQFKWCAMGEPGEDGGGGSNITTDGPAFFTNETTAYEQITNPRGMVREFMAPMSTAVLWFNDGTSSQHATDWFWAIQSSDHPINQLHESMNELYV